MINFADLFICIIQLARTGIMSIRCLESKMRYDFEIKNKIKINNNGKSCSRNPVILYIEFKSRIHARKACKSM